ncbi:hypothetical protein [Burkholderia cenocepacia]|uniref:hypothetical protein n=1 Tax=Burkholderia cenocepacia TaxID=95486 RepID=UPI00076209AD|nr:hypothetical protein [Burkholderia cenocepacia]KWU17879.1 hypothetical protein AS149_14480 [Burkholderia cenocepacia]
MQAVEVVSYVAGVLGLIWCAAKIDALMQSSKKANETGASAPSIKRDAPAIPAAEAHAPRPLDIDGTERPKLQSLGFLKGYAVRPEFVTDVVRYAKAGSLDSFPQAVQHAIRVLFNDGALKGTEIVGILFRNEPLEDGQAVYFAMVNPPKQPAFAVGFVDKASH